MNKKINTALFLLCATVLNLFILAAVALVLLLFFGLVYRNMVEVPTGLSWLAIIVVLFGSIVATFFIYSRLIKWIVGKWQIDRYIEPIFHSPKRPNRD